MASEILWPVSMRTEIRGLLSKKVMLMEVNQKIFHALIILESMAFAMKNEQLKCRRISRPIEIQNVLHIPVHNPDIDHCGFCLC